jgi:hypothetical protein
MLGLRLPWHAVCEVVFNRVILEVVVLAQQILLHIAPRQLVGQVHLLLLQASIHEVDLLLI